MSDTTVFLGASIFDGDSRREHQVLVVTGGVVEAILPEGEVDPGWARVELDGGLIAPGFVDIQVNGGGGVLLNETPTVEGVRAICAAHARVGGSTALLPTIITDRPEITYAAIEAVAHAMAIGVPGCAGIHVEGPFLSQARKGAHEPAFIRPMGEEDLQRLVATDVRPLLLTVAPESVTNDQISRLSAAGIHVSLGHTDCDYDTAMAAFDAGASCVTHLFNAMSPLTHRAPGLVGAALDAPDVFCGFIADGHHVHPAALGAAIRAKRGRGRMLAVTDAMPTVGSEADSFVLNGRVTTRESGRLTLADGTLAGSDLSMVGALRYLMEEMGIDFVEALRMCSLYPAIYLGLRGRIGSFEPGARADIVHLNDDLGLSGVWIGGRAAR
ncbi:N-acetylglucosamine-6-phosphate deacetylase [Aureimonas mangrovi]|uniref:N-acetylglucosamine-6-phosphate deacetylase n=1 Tax=Aureimonas mangrovi TaxID=2758041 RepID=UPI00163D4A53|nr:N-acetylglucosamine-6-phosphate deacetylase [Aureimonas mangrovi]